MTSVQASNPLVTDPLLDPEGFVPLPPASGFFQSHVVTPLIGLLGTVVGLIESFVNVTSQSGFASATDISSGIYQSLLTTAGGLVVAIPCAVGYSYLSSRVNALLHDMERAGIEIVNLISENRHPAVPEIIEFGPQPARRQSAD